MYVKVNIYNVVSVTYCSVIYQLVSLCIDEYYLFIFVLGFLVFVQ